jgi:hypothetical protein
MPPGIDLSEECDEASNNHSHTCPEMEATRQQETGPTTQSLQEMDYAERRRLVGQSLQESMAEFVVELTPHRFKVRSILEIIVLECMSWGKQ